MEAALAEALSLQGELASMSDRLSSLTAHLKAGDGPHDG